MSTRLTDQQHLSKIKLSKLGQIQKARGEEEMASVEALEVGVMATINKGMFEEKSKGE